MKRLVLIACLAVFGGAFESLAAPISCVPYVRQVSAVDLRGDAWRWWQAAAGVYERGAAPREGAVLVFKRHGRMYRGHVAVVSSIVNSREVLIDHANWAPTGSRLRGKVAENVRVRDVSARNDWSEVRVGNQWSQELGAQAWPAYGFIYAPKASPIREARTTIEDARQDYARPPALLTGPEMCQPSDPDTVAMLLEDLESGESRPIEPTRVLWAEPTAVQSEMVSER